MPIRAIVVDDSVVIRRSVSTMLAAEADIEIVATAADGRLALRRIESDQPDVVTLDIEMPGMDGIETLTEIRKRWPRLPVIMYSTLTERGAEITMQALSLGAVDYAAKPSGVGNRAEVAAHVQANLLPLVRLWGTRPAPASLPHPSRARRTAALVDAPVSPTSTDHRVDVVVIGVSTGGPDALARLVPMLSPRLPVPMVVVQHMPPVFTAMLARRLDLAGALPVTEAADGEQALPGHVYIAPGGSHTELRAGSSAGSYGMVHTDAAPENSCRPAVDVLFRSAVTATRGHLLGVVLTGMGQDGLAGAQLIRDKGGSVLAQDEASSVVWGMPGFVSRAGLANAVLPLDQIAAAIERCVTSSRRTRVPA